MRSRSTYLKRPCWSGYATGETIRVQMGKVLVHEHLYLGAQIPKPLHIGIDCTSRLRTPFLASASNVSFCHSGPFASREDDEVVPVGDLARTLPDLSRSRISESAGGLDFR